MHCLSKIQCIYVRHRIAVIGGGPAGLTFARVLHRHDHPVTVIERDPAPDARPPGGTLDLHEKLGQLALSKAGLLAEFQALSRPEGQAMRILDTDGTVLRDCDPVRMTGPIPRSTEATPRPAARPPRRSVGAAA